MIFLGVGGNLPCETFGQPRATCGAALQILEARGVKITARGRWYESAPVPASDQPWYVNGVVAVKTSLDPVALIREMLDVEAELGRRRTVANAPRTIDLDVVAYGDWVIEPTTPGGAAIPHPRMHQRAFVLKPLADIAPDWRHPATDRALSELLDELPKNQICRPLPDAAGLFGTEWAGNA